jgi:hypothetical protein
MKEMAKHVPDAGSYAPVTILVDEREDGVHLSICPMTEWSAFWCRTKTGKRWQSLTIWIIRSKS